MKTRLKTFLEDFHNENSLTAEEAADLINTRGQHYKQLIGNIHENLLYRGMRERFAPDAVLKWPRTNRRPLTTNGDVHKAADEFFDETFGIRFRSNSIFATGDKETAAYYGDVYAIFPLDEPKLCWSEDVNDMTNHLHTFLGGSEVDGKMVHNSIAMTGERLAARVHHLRSVVSRPVGTLRRAPARRSGSQPGYLVRPCRSLWRLRSGLR